YEADMNSVMARWLTVVTVLVLTGCAAPQPQVRSNFDKTADFRSYRTYNIMGSAGRKADGYESLVGQALRTAVEQEMESRGYVKAADPDLLVNFSVTVQKVQQVSQVPTAGPPAPYYYRGGYYRTWPAYSYETWVREYDEGTLLIDIVDSKRQQLVWEAAGTGRLKKDLTENIDQRARDAVALLFTRYPFRAGSGPG
ncbi:MAG: DUF4136 domain-containing protein, partial [Gammaproteobacteria bacterium]